MATNGQFSWPSVGSSVAAYGQLGMAANIARLRRQLSTTEQRLETTGVALEIMSKMHELLESLSKSSRDEKPHTKP